MEATDRKAFFASFKATQPRNLIFHYGNVKIYADNIFRIPVPKYVSPKLDGV